MKINHWNKQSGELPRSMHWWEGIREIWEAASLPRNMLSSCYTRLHVREQHDSEHCDIDGGRESNQMTPIILTPQYSLNAIWVPRSFDALCCTVLSAHRVYCCTTSHILSPLNHILSSDHILAGAKAATLQLTTAQEVNNLIKFLPIYISDAT